jgi:hypothetical protein
MIPVTMRMRPSARLTLSIPAPPLLVAFIIALSPAACDRSERPDRESPTSGAATTPPRPLPHYEFARGLESEHPEVVAFVRQFLETCLAGDYAGYRLLTSRRHNPESEERFRAIYNATRNVLVESIRPLQEPAADGSSTYLVVSSIDLDPSSRVSIRGESRTIAFLAFREAGEWRVAPAPARLQPQPESQPVDPTSTESPLPDYPWDLDGDG